MQLIKFKYRYTICYAIVDSTNFKSLAKFTYIAKSRYIYIDLDICEKYEISSSYPYNISGVS